MTSGSLPGGLELTEAGELSGVPSEAGTSSFVVTVVDSSQPALSRSREYKLPVLPLILPTTLANAEQGSPYEQTLLVHGDNFQPFSFDVSGLPAGLEANGFTGGELVISGVPQEAGVFSVSVSVTDSASPALTGKRKYKLRVKAGVEEGEELPPGNWELVETGPPNRDGVVVEPHGKLHDEDFAPGTWTLHGGHLVFTLEVARGDVFTYEGNLDVGVTPESFSGVEVGRGGTFVLERE